jgi:Xaa-Pro aminopeptidase
MKPIGFSRSKVSKLMQDAGIDVLVASSPENVFYCSGLPTIYATPNPVLAALSNQYPNLVIITRDGEEILVFWQLFRSVDKVSWIKRAISILSSDESLQRLISIIKETGLPDRGTIGVESLMPVYQYEGIVRAFPEAKIKVSDDLFIEMRLEKSEEEIRRIQEATAASERSVEAAINCLREGISVMSLAMIARARMADEGMADVCHVTIGIGDSDPEYPSSDVEMKRGDIARFDVGAVYEGYSSDVSRHACVAPPPREATTLNDLMVETQEACVHAIRPGIKPVEAVDAAYDVFNKHGGLGFFFISIHSIGISIEDYRFYDTVMGPSPRPFGSNMVIDVETWTVLPQQGLIGIGDPYLVTGQGCRRLSKMEKRIFRVDQRK